MQRFIVTTAAMTFLVVNSPNGISIKRCTGISLHIQSLKVPDSDCFSWVVHWLCIMCSPCFLHDMIYSSRHN